MNQPIPKVEAVSGIIKRPPLIVVHGPGGVGKSSFAAGAPHCAFSDIEEGTAYLNLKRLKSESGTPFVENYQDVLNHIEFLLLGEHDYQSYCIDGLDQLELMIQEYVCATKKQDGKKVEEFEDYTWGKGQSFALKEWAKLFDRLKTLRKKRNIPIILIAHSDEKIVENIVVGESYKRFKIKLSPKITNLVIEQSDCVLFANPDVVVSKDRFNKVSAFSEGETVCYSEVRPQWDAKNRLGLPLQFPLRWHVFWDEFQKASPESPEAIKQAIEGLLTRVEDEELREKATKAFHQAGDQIVSLTKIRTRLETLLHTKEV